MICTWAIPNAVSLAKAREKAAAGRAMGADGVNPIKAKREGRRLAARTPIFGEVADALIEGKELSWK